MQTKNNKFSDNLKKFRKLNGISQDELSDKTSLSKRMISYYENKAINPPFDKIELIANALKISVSDLLDEKKTINNNDFEKIDSRITRRIIRIKKLPLREQTAIWKYIDYILDQNEKKQKQLTDSKK